MEGGNNQGVQPDTSPEERILSAGAPGCSRAEQEIAGAGGKPRGVLVSPREPLLQVDEQQGGLVRSATRG